MTDRITPSQRSTVMGSVGGKNTKPEVAVRSLAHRLGYRFRLHRKDLPGKPDLVFPSKKKVIFVHGCFWHRHSCKKGKSMLASNCEFWRDKFARNCERDEANLRELKKIGWRALVIWECEIDEPDRLTAKLQSFLVSAAEGPRKNP